MELKNYTQQINFTPELEARIAELIGHYPEDKRHSALIPVMHEVQDAHDNWLSAELMDRIAEIIGITPIEVYEVATFYTMFNLQPIGKYMFEFCITSCCSLRGAEQIMDYTCKKLNIAPGETTADGMFTVVGVQCLGACGYAPMMQLGDFYREHLTEAEIDQIIEDCRSGKIILHDK